MFRDVIPGYSYDGNVNVKVKVIQYTLLRLKYSNTLLQVPHYLYLYNTTSVYYIYL